MNHTSSIIGYRILLIENNRYLRDELRSALENQGCSVVTVPSAEEGLATVKAGRFEVLICAADLPGMDGAELLRQARELGKASVSLLMVGYDDLYPEDNLAEWGIDQIIEKPFSFAALMEAIAQKQSEIHFSPLSASGREDSRRRTLAG
jgi:DNA-binding response OmpR family regulator